MRTKKLALALAVAFSVGAYNASAQDAAEATSTTPTAAGSETVTIKDDAGSGGTAVKTGKDSAGRDTLSVDFPDEEIRNILRNVADLFELNLVIPETLQGKTSIKLRDVTWRQIFQVVLQPVNYSYIEDGSIIRVVDNASLQQEPTSTEVFILNYAKASDVQPVVASMVEANAGGKLVVDTRSNALVITERPSRFNRIRPIIESLDRATDQVMIESKFIEVSDSDAKNLGIKWTSLGGYDASIGPFSSNWAETLKNGVRPDGSLDKNLTETSYTAPTYQNVGTATNPVYEQLTPAVTKTTYSSSQTITNSAAMTGAEFKATLTALNTLSDSKVISNPTIVTLNNTEATINVGEEYPIPNYTYNQEQGAFEVSGFNYKPLGVLLKVTPQVNARGFIKLTLEPEVSARGTDAVTFGTAAIPVINTRKTKTQISMKDGYTMGIGGLLSKSDINGSTKVPVLGSIPIIGNLFKSKSKENSMKNLLIFITAKIVNAEGASVNEVFDPEQIRLGNVHERDLPGHREQGNIFVPPEPPKPHNALRDEIP